MAAAETKILLAVIGAAHGIRGEVRVRSFTGDPMALADYGPLHDRAGRSFEIAALRPAGSVVIARFKGVADRNAAEALAGTNLFVDRSALPRHGGDDDEFYHADLVGLDVRDGDGNGLGTVQAVQNFGGGDLLEIGHSGRSRFIPFTRAAVPQVALEAGYLVVDPVAAGLSDTADEEPPR